MSDLRGARLSSAARCIRQAAYSAVDAEADPLPPDAELYFSRGKMFETYIGWQLDAKHGKDNVQRQVPVPWGDNWHGHADFVLHEQTVVEVVSTVVPSPHVFGFKSGQAKRYLHHLGLTDGLVFVVNPSTLKGDDVLPIRLTDDDRQDFDTEATAIVTAARTGDVDALPRVCRKPGDARGYLCSYASTCFAGWEAPPASENDLEEARRAAHDLYQAKQRERNLKAQITSAESDRKEAQAILSELLEPGETQVGPFMVKRIPVKGRVTVKNELLESGLIPGELLAPYVNVSSGCDRFDITRESDAAALMADDFGSEAPF